MSLDTLSDGGAMPEWCCRGVLTLLLLGMAGAVPLDGQTGGSGRPCFQLWCPAPEPEEDWRIGTSGQLAALGANVAVGGLTAGIRQWRGEGSFWDGLWRGGAGGAATYLGKRIVAVDSPVPAVVGRKIAAVGASVTRNASENEPSFERVMIPLGPARFHLEPRAGTVHTSLDLFAAAAIVGTYMAGLGASLDLRRSLESGAPVFLAHDWKRDWGWQGRHVGGAILLRGDDPGTREHGELMTRALGHERVHLLQYDQAYILWGEALERRVLEGVGAPPGLVRRLDASLSGIAFSALGAVLPHRLVPWETEADILAKTLRDR
jgi:hypothetical protein